MRMTDKNTFTGRDLRDYQCDECGYEDSEDRGVALWVLMSEASRDARMGQGGSGASESTASAVAATAAEPRRGVSLWDRMASLFGRSK